MGDKVVHTGRPEWGAGTVTAAMSTTQDGRACQSLTVRFERAGTKTLSTAYAVLMPASDAASLPPAPVAPSAPPAKPGPGKPEAPTLDSDDLEFLARLRGGTTGEVRERMTRLPEPATDPFSTPVGRLKATLNLYKFTPTGASLLDWAAVQSGLSDPLSRFNRHELEQFFQQFVVVRDAHLKKLVLDMKKQDPAGLASAVAGAPPAAQQLLRRFDGGR